MAYSRLKCPKCEFDFGQEAKFLDHLADIHGISGEKDNIELYLDGKQHPTCNCSNECQIRLPWAGWKKGFTSKYARGHNARVYTAFGDPVVAKQLAKNRTEAYKSGNMKVWNDGQTAQTNEMIAEMAKKTSKTLRDGYTSGKYKKWQLGHTKDDHPSLLQASKTHIESYASGRIKSWTDGLTKETDVRIAEAARKMSERYNSPDAGNRIKLNELVKRFSIHDDDFELVTPLEEYTGRRVRRLTFRCKTCDSEVTKSLAMLEETPVCFICHPKNSTSYPELQVFEFVKSLLPTEQVDSGTYDVISPHQIDVFVPEQMFGIEFNGLKHHSSEFKTKDFHSNKTKNCSEKGVTLMHIFSDEWRDKRPIIESMVRSRLGQCSHVTGARKCKIQELDTKTRREFFVKNHIDGDVKAKISWGLFDVSGVLVAAISLRALGMNVRKKYQGSIELARSCSLLNTSIPGALGRLTKHAVSWAKQNGYVRILTYVDLRHGTGKSYEKVGYEKIGVTPNRFWWVIGSQRVDRFSIRADSKNGISEKEVAKQRNAFRIYGCPNNVYVMPL